MVRTNADPFGAFNNEAAIQQTIKEAIKEANESSVQIVQNVSVVRNTVAPGDASVVRKSVAQGALGVGEEGQEVSLVERQGSIEQVFRAYDTEGKGDLAFFWIKSRLEPYFDE